MRWLRDRLAETKELVDNLIMGKYTDLSQSNKRSNTAPRQSPEALRQHAHRLYTRFVRPGRLRINRK